MAYKFIGEDVPELKLFPKAQRRTIFLRAARNSYGHFSTWAGFCLCVAVTYCGVEYSVHINESLRRFFAAARTSEMFLNMGISLVGLGALYYFQIKAIKAELLKLIESQQRDTPNHQNRTTFGS